MRLATVVLISGLAGCGSFAAGPPGTDGGGLDATVQGDGGADGAAGLDGGGRWCQQQGKHDFCADFDDGRKIEAIFDSLKDISTAPDGPSIRIDAAKSKSAPGALLFFVPKDPPSLQLFADLNFVSASKGFSCSFDLSFDTLPNGYLGSLVWVQLGVPTSPDFRVTLADSLSFDSAPGAIPSRNTNFALPGKSWARVGLSVDVAGHKIAASLDGKESASLDMPVVDAVHPSIHFGTLYPNGPAFAFRFDNILCDMLP